VRWLIAILLSVRAWAGSDFTVASSQYIDISSVVDDISSNGVGSVVLCINVTDYPDGTNLTHFSVTDLSASTDYFYINIAAPDSALRIGLNTSVAQWRIDFNDRLELGRHCVAIVQDGVSPVVYVDGDTVSFTLAITTDVTAWFDDMSNLDAATIGAFRYNSSSLFYINNAVYDLHIYSRALSEIEIKSLSANSVVLGDLKGHWRIDECPAGTNVTNVYDISGYGNHGTAINNPTYTAEPIKTKARK